MTSKPGNNTGIHISIELWQIVSTSRRQIRVCQSDNDHEVDKSVIKYQRPESVKGLNVRTFIYYTAA